MRSNLIIVTPLAAVLALAAAGCGGGASHEAHMTEVTRQPEETTPPPGSLVVTASYEKSAGEVFTNKLKGFSAQEKLMGKNAAEADAYAKLAKQVRGLWVEGFDVVRNFVTESSVRTVGFSAYLKGAQLIDFDATPDGICTVTAKMDITEFVKTLDYIKKTRYNGTKAYEFKKIVEMTRKRSIVVKGFGACRGSTTGAGGGDAIPGSVQ